MPFDVYLNVYDLTDRNKYIYPFGLGVYHSGVEINQVEYAFGGHEYLFTGIFKMRPKTDLPGIKFRESILLGQVDLTRDQLGTLLVNLGQKYTGRSYNLLTRNCNHFAEELAQILCNRSIPGWINRLALLGSWMPCFVDTSAEHFEPPNAMTADPEHPPELMPFDRQNSPLSMHPSSSSIVLDQQ